MSSAEANRSTARGSGRGLYGSQVGDRLVRATVAELTGTALLVFVGTSAAVAAGLDAGYDSLAVVLAFGVTLVALAAAFGHVSGCT